MARSTSLCNLEAVAESSGRNEKASSGAKTKAISIVVGLPGMRDSALILMLVGAQEWPRFPRLHASCRMWDSVYYLDRRCVRESASGDLSEIRRGIQFLRPEESAHVSRGSLLLKIELRSNPEMLCVVRNALGELAAKLGFSEPECRAVVLAVDEALTNIIRHAYLGDPEQSIEASFRRIHVLRDGKSEDALEILLEDSGATASPEKMCGRALEDVRPGGLGLHFIRKSMDTVEFSHSNGRNQLRLVKILHGQTTQKGS